MKNLLLITVAVLFQISAAHAAPGVPKDAKTVVCNFTEPFFGITVDLQQKTMTITSMADLAPNIVSERTDKLTGLKITDGGHANLIVWHVSEYSNDQIELLNITTMDKGSNGMSDEDYDGSGYFTLDGKTQVGGCNFAK